MNNLSTELEIKINKINYKIAELQEIIKHKDQEIYNFKHRIAEQKELIEDKNKEVKRLRNKLNVHKTEEKGSKMNGQLKNPEIIHFIANNYCNGHGTHWIKKQLHEIYDIEINRGAIGYWLRKYKKYIDLDAIRQKEKVSLSDCILIANNFQKKKKYPKRKKCSNPGCNNFCWATKKSSVCQECLKKGKHSTVSNKYVQKRHKNKMEL